MSGKRPADIEKKLYDIAETMVSIRHDMQTGKIETKYAFARLRELSSLYQKMKSSTIPEIDSEEI